MSIPTRITISHLFNVIKTAGSNTKVPLGRWSIKTDRPTGLIADYSNEDHCGTCGDYINNKTNNKNFTSTTTYDLENIYNMEYTYMVSNNPN
jgi:hypothetical protein